MSSAPQEERSAAAVEGPRRRLLLVSLVDAVIGLPADSVVEVITARPFSHLPGAAECVAGLVNRRGRILTVIDLGVALGGASTAEIDGHRIVIVSYLAKEIGLTVKDVLQVTEDWWSDSSEGEPARWDGTGGGDEQLRVVELDAVLSALFGESARDVGEPSFERS